MRQDTRVTFAVRPDEDLDSIFAWREQRKVTSNLTLHYERKLYLLPDTPKTDDMRGSISMSINFPMARSRFALRARRSPTPLTTSWAQSIKVLLSKTSA